MVSQEVAQLSGGEDTTITGVMSEYGIQLGPPQELPAELLDLYVVQTTVSGSVASLGHGDEIKSTMGNRHTRINNSCNKV